MPINVNRKKYKDMVQVLEGNKLLEVKIWSWMKDIPDKKDIIAPKDNTKWKCATT